MGKMEKETIEELKEEIKKVGRKKRELEIELKKAKVKKCSFCQKELPTDHNNYLKNRYRLAFWNNQKADERLVCYPCLKYG
jgi:DNA repair exonuclease SbcCD ATPase subunit